MQETTEETTDAESIDDEPAVSSGRAHQLGALAGAVLVGRALRRRRPRDLIQAGVGIGLVWWGLRNRGGNATSGAQPIEVRRSVTVQSDLTPLAEALQDQNRLANALGEQVELIGLDADRMRLYLDGPLNRTFTWTLELMEVEPDALRWEAREGLVDGVISADLSPATSNEGTEVAIEVELTPRGGPLGRWALSRFESLLSGALGRTLQRFKSEIETGEIATLEGNPSGRGEGDYV